MCSTSYGMMGDCEQSCACSILVTQHTSLMGILLKEKANFIIYENIKIYGGSKQTVSPISAGWPIMKMHEQKLQNMKN